MTLKELIVIAWRVQPYQIAGGPPWLDSAHYDIVASAETKPKPDQMPLMIQSLLEDRFQLTIHREIKELPIYALVLARKDGKLGPGLTESKEGGCMQIDPSKPPPPPEPGKPPTLGCGGIMMGPSRLTALSVPLAQITPMLGRFLGRTVTDKSGLTGKFDIRLEWTPDEMQLAQFAPGAQLPPEESGGPSIFTAVEQQLGLKLESQKGPVETIVIDRAEKPSEN
jgi:uncharacterized protein (TIGR03435 family)